MRARDIVSSTSMLTVSVKRSYFINMNIINKTDDVLYSARSYIKITSRCWPFTKVNIQNNNNKIDAA